MTSRNFPYVVVYEEDDAAEVADAVANLCNHGITTFESDNAAGDWAPDSNISAIVWGAVAHFNVSRVDPNAGARKKLPRFEQRFLELDELQDVPNAGKVDFAEAEERRLIREM